MAQKQYTTYQADILSFELRDALLGLVKPGRYIGFDTMTEYQAQSGNNVYCRISHTGHITKYDKASPPVSEANRGVAVSTQGTIIAEDSNVDFTTVIHPGSSSGYWYLIYMEHEYTEVQGANPATYGIITGTDGGGKPALTSPTNRIIIGYIWEAIDPSGFSDLTYHPYQSADHFGDAEIGEKLFGDAEVLDDVAGGNVGTIPSEGVIGNRNFTTNNFLTDYNSITKALSDLDAELSTAESERDAIGARGIDNASWGALADNTNHNASITTHGLTPKLPNNAAYFLDGVGTWKDIHTYVDEFTFLRSSPPTILQVTNGASTSGTVDVTPTYAPVGIKAIVVNVDFQYNTVTGSGSNHFNMWDADYSYTNGPGLWSADDNNAQNIPTLAKAQWIIPVNAAGEFDWSCTNGDFTILTIKLAGYIL